MLKPLLTNELKNTPFALPYLTSAIAALLKPCATLIYYQAKQFNFLVNI